jgi:hypothetical protein
MAEAIADVLRARRIEIVDGAGVVRATLGVVADQGIDVVVVGLCSPEGREHLTLACDEDNASLSLWERGNGAAALTSNRGGYAGLVLSEPDEGTAFHILTNGAA